MAGKILLLKGRYEVSLHRDLVPRYSEEYETDVRSSVYEALDKELDREVAVKILKLEYRGDPERLAQARNETFALNFHHPNVMSLLDVGQLGDDTYFCVMPILNGYDVRKIIDRSHNFFNVRQIARMVDQVSSGLAFIHEMDSAHNDFLYLNPGTKERKEKDVNVFAEGDFREFHGGASVCLNRTGLGPFHYRVIDFQKQIFLYAGRCLGNGEEVSQDEIHEAQGRDMEGLGRIVLKAMETTEHDIPPSLVELAVTMADQHTGYYHGVAEFRTEFMTEYARLIDGGKLKYFQ